MSGTPKYQISPKFIFKFNFWSAILVPPFILFINVEFTDSSLNMSRTVNKVTSDSSKFSINSHFSRLDWNRRFLFIYLFISLLFVISIFKNAELPNIKYIRSKERCTSMLQMNIKT